jgi:predicted dehydrogenase
MKNHTTRRTFLQAAGLGAAVLAAQGVASGTQQVVDKDGKTVQGFEDIKKANAETSKGWKPISDRKIRVGIVGYGFCRFGAAFGFQDHPNVEVVAVSDLIPDRRDGLAKACRCKKTYDSLEELVKDDRIEAVFCATDPPHHVQHCIEVLKHGKHVGVTVPAVWGSLEQADQLYEAVKKARGLKYMMFETSYFHPGLWPMRQIYKAGGFGKHIYSEGEYYHYHDGSAPMPSYKGWRDGPPPLWYATHSTAYYIGVTGGTLTHVSCQARPSNWYWLKPRANKFDNTHATETALFRTSDGGAFRALCCYDSPGHEGVKGRFRGELGSFDGDAGDGKRWGTFQGLTDGKGKKPLPNLNLPPLPPNVDPGGHGGAEGQLMNDFVTAILANRTPIVNVAEALNMTVAGVVASESAKKDGELLRIPQFTMPT